MKSVWKSLGMIVMLTAVLLGASLVNAQIAKRASAEADAKRPSAVKDWGKPDLESLSAYGLAPFETTLPVVFIDTGGQRITKENKIWAAVSVLNADPEGRPRLILETPDYQEAATVKYRGASSYSQFDKPQYRIKFYRREGSGKARNIAFLGMGEHSEWVLNGPFLDKTLIRNRLVYGLGREMFEWAPDTRFAEVFVDGEYQGVYVAVEPVTNGASRLRLSEFGLLSGEMAYVVKRDRAGSEENPLEVYGKTNGKTSNNLYVEYPAAKNLTDAQRAWIQEDISAFERALYGERFDDISLGYRRYIDMDCFADYFVLNEVFMNHDGGKASITDRDRALYQRFCSALRWENLDLGDTRFPWACISYGAVLLGDHERAQTYLASFQARYGENRDYPFHTAEAGWAARTCAGLLTYYQERMQLGLLDAAAEKIGVIDHMYSLPGT